MTNVRTIHGSEIDAESGVNLPTKIDLRAVAELLPYARNSRTHSPAQVDHLAGLIRRFGWTNPCIVADGVLLAGHGRIMAAQKLGLARVPCIDLSHLSDNDRRAYVIADNRSSEMSGWDLDMLKAETDDLREAGFDLEATVGFSEEDLAAMFADLDPGDQDSEGGDPDATPELPDVPVSQVGDVWVCGPHRVACGDSTDPVTWQELLQGEVADLCITDPPYNVDIGEKNRSLDRNDGGKRSKSGAIENDKMSAADFRDFLLRAYQAMFGVMKPGAPIYVAHADREAHVFRQSFEDAGFKFQSMIVWRKNQIVLSRTDYQSVHEPILYGWKPGAAHRWYGGRKRKTIMDAGEGSPFQQLPDGRWAIQVGDQVLIVDGQATLEEAPGSVAFHAKPSRSELHPTTKPVGLWEKLMKPSSRPGDIVIDPFSGSGTTLVAADRMGLIARVCELDPKFVDVAVIRWQMLTGRRAVHARTGQKFPMAGERPDQDPPQDATNFLQPPSPETQDVF